MGAFLTFSGVAQADFQPKPYAGTDTAVSRSCQFEDEDEVYLMSVKQSGSLRLSTAVDFPVPGATTEESLDVTTGESSGRVSGAMSATFAPMDFGAGFNGTLNGKSFTCYTVHEQPSMEEMAAYAAPVMKEIYDEVKDMGLVMGPVGNQQPINVSLGRAIKSADNIVAS